MVYFMYYFASFFFLHVKMKIPSLPSSLLKINLYFLITTFLIKLLDIKKKLLYTSGKKTKKG